MQIALLIDRIEHLAHAPNVLTRNDAWAVCTSDFDATPPPRWTSGGGREYARMDPALVRGAAGRPVYSARGNAPPPDVLSSLVAVAYQLDWAGPERADYLSRFARLGVAPKGSGRGTSEAHARAWAASCAPWNGATSDAVHWRDLPSFEAPLEADGTLPTGAHAAMYTALGSPPASRPRGSAVRAFRAAYGMSVAWRRACNAGEIVPKGHGAASGRSFAELPDPFGPLLALWDAGVAPLECTADGVYLATIARAR